MFAAQAEHTGDNAAMIAFAASIDPPQTAAALGITLQINPSLALPDY